MLNLLICFIIIALLVLAIYYIVVIVTFFEDNFDNKKEFILWLIPYYGIFYKIKHHWDYLD